MDHDANQDVIGETLAKFEFFENNWNPYNRFLDVDNVDIVLRRRVAPAAPLYREVLVRFGRLREVTSGWERDLFDVVSSRSFADGEFEGALSHLFVTYVLSRQSDHGQGNNYKGDFFVFPIQRFSAILKVMPLLANRRQLTFWRSNDGERWFIRRSRAEFDKITKDTVIDVTEFRRAFHLLESTG